MTRLCCHLHATELRTLLERTECHTLFSVSGTKIDHILTKRFMRHFVIESLEQLLSGGSVTDRPYGKAFKEGATDPFIIKSYIRLNWPPQAHQHPSSGLATIDAHHLQPLSNGYEAQANMPGTRVANMIQCQPFMLATY